MRLGLTYQFAFILTPLILGVVADTCWAEDLEGSISIVGNRVSVRAHREDKSPAAGAKIRLVKAGQMIVEGKIDDAGFWHRDIEKAGAYEIWLGEAANDDDLLKMPISISADMVSKAAPSTSGFLPCCRGPFLKPWDASDVETSVEFPWGTTGAGFGLLAAAALLFLRFRANALTRSIPDSLPFDPA